MKKILVADDSLPIQKAVELALHNQDYEVISVRTGKQALTQAQTWKPHLILADVKMPNGNGFFLSKAVKSSPSLKETKVVLLHSPLENILEDKLRESLADSTLSKPFNAQQLRELCARLLEKKRSRIGPVPDRLNRGSGMTIEKPRDAGNVAPDNIRAKSDVTWDFENVGKVDIDQEIENLGSPNPPASQKIPVQKASDTPSSKKNTENHVTQEAKTIIEKIGWEVIPKLSEKIIREELAKL